MILEADKKEEEAARERPGDYIRALQGVSSGSSEFPVSRPRGNSLGQRTSNGVSTEERTSGDVHSGNTTEDESDSVGVLPAHAQDLEEAERQRRLERRRRRPQWPWQNEVTWVTDERRTLLPPTYREATIGLEKRKRRRILWYTLLCILVVATVIVVTEQVDEWFYRRRVDKAGWLSGGRDGKGKYDDDWDWHFPRLASEIAPRQCDLFSKPVELPAWSSPSTSARASESFATYLIPSNATSVTFNGRGSKLTGDITVLSGQAPDLGQRFTSKWDPDGDQILITVVAIFSNVAAMEFHSCLFGKDGVYGVSLVGRPDAGPPVTSTWLEGYFQFAIYISFPRSSYSGAGTVLQRKADFGALHVVTQNMGFSMTSEGAWFKDVFVETTQALISAGVVQSRGSIKLTNTKGAIYARDLTSSEGNVVLWTTEGSLHCDACVASEYIVAFLGKGRMSGDFKAGRGIDVTGSNGPITGTFDGPRLWVTNNEGGVSGTFSGMELSHGSEVGGLLLQTTIGDVDIEVACGSGREPHDVSTETPHPAEDPLKLVIIARHGNIKAELTELPVITPTLLSISTSDGWVKAKLPQTWQGEIALQPASWYKSWLTWSNGAYGGGPRRKLEVKGEGSRAVPWGDLEWQGPASGNVTAVDKRDDGPWNFVRLASDHGDVRLQL